jgi:hypothetical protein
MMAAHPTIPRADHSIRYRQKSGPNAGCALRLSCFWIPQVGYGIRSLGDHILRCRAVRF